MPTFLQVDMVSQPAKQVGRRGLGAAPPTRSRAHSAALAGGAGRQVTSQLSPRAPTPLPHPRDSHSELRRRGREHLRGCARNKTRGEKYGPFNPRRITRPNIDRLRKCFRKSRPRNAPPAWSCLVAHPVPRPQSARRMRSGHGASCEGAPADSVGWRSKQGRTEGRARVQARGGTAREGAIGHAVHGVCTLPLVCEGWGEGRRAREKVCAPRLAASRITASCWRIRRLYSIMFLLACHPAQGSACGAGARVCVCQGGSRRVVLGGGACE